MALETKCGNIMKLWNKAACIPPTIIPQSKWTFLHSDARFDHHDRVCMTKCSCCRVSCWFERMSNWTGVASKVSSERIMMYQLPGEWSSLGRKLFFFTTEKIPQSSTTVLLRGPLGLFRSKSPPFFFFDCVNMLINLVLMSSLITLMDLFGFWNPVLAV